MKVILLSDVAKLGRIYDVKDVNSGYATNFLIPRKLAVAATPEALKSVQKAKEKADGERKVKNDLLAKSLEELDGKSITMTEKVNEKGHLFAGLHREEIAKKLFGETRIEIDPNSIILEEPIKSAGEHVIEIKVGAKSAKVKITIEAGK